MKKISFEKSEAEIILKAITACIDEDVGPERMDLIVDLILNEWPELRFQYSRLWKWISQ